MKNKYIYEVWENGYVTKEGFLAGNWWVRVYLIQYLFYWLLGYEVRIRKIK